MPRKTNLTDTPANRKKFAKILERMEAEILLSSFSYEHYFPKNDKVSYFDELGEIRQTYKVVYHSLESLFGNGLIKGILSGGQLIKKSLESSSISI